MSLYDVIFWLLIILIAALAFSIESGLAARHKRVVLSSIFSATIAAAYIMFMVDDKSSFDFGPVPVQEEGDSKKTVVAMENEGGGGGKEEVEVVHVAGAKTKAEKDAAERAAENNRLMNTPGGFKECDVCPLMTVVHAGKYTMGSPNEEAGRGADEGPRKEITFTHPFAVSRYEILRREYAVFVKQERYQSTKFCIADRRLREDLDWINPGFVQGDRHPVACVSWQDANAFAAWLSKRTKRKYRLLTESEWEYVARAGATGAFALPTPVTGEVANFGGTRSGTMEGGKFKQNPFELFDLAGNVWEMVADCYLDDLTAVPKDGTAVRSIGACKHSIRGGGWDSPAIMLRVAEREKISGDAGYSNVGFRLARDMF